MRRGEHQDSTMKSHITLLIIGLLLFAMSDSTYAYAAKQKERTHYEVLGLTQDASLQDVKKAYRKLAVQHHPDRNLGNEEEATIKFREVNEAYEILSDEQSRKQYDKMLRYGGAGGGGSGGGHTFNWSTGGGARERREFKHRDPFAQFNDVFKNDPFFAEARKSMDDLFDKHFSSVSSETGKEAQVSSGGFWNKLKAFLPDIQIESEVTMGGKTTRTSRNFGNSRSSSSGRSTYTSRSTSTTIENGQRVTTQTLEKDGNRIEEKYIGKKLIERKINGIKEDIGRIDQGEF